MLASFGVVDRTETSTDGFFFDSRRVTPNDVMTTRGSGFFPGFFVLFLFSAPIFPPKVPDRFHAWWLSPPLKAGGSAVVGV